MIFLLLACVPKQDRAAALLSEGYGIAACELATDKGAIGSALPDRMELELALEVLPIEAFAVPPRGYGEDFAVIVLGVHRRPGLAQTLELDLRIDGFEPCPTCTPEWIAARMTPELPPLEPEPTTDETVNRGSHTALGSLASAVVETGKALGTVGRIVGSVVLGTAFAPLDLYLTGIAWKSGYRMEMSQFFMRQLGGEPALRRGGGAPAVTLVEAERGGFTLETDAPAVSQWVVTGEGIPAWLEVEATATAGSCEGTGVKRIPLNGATLIGALQSGLPATGTRLEFAEAP